MTFSELQRVRTRLEALSVEERKRLRGMRDHRADIVVAGALVLELLMQQSGYEQLTVCRASVREGVLWREAQNLARRKKVRHMLELQIADRAKARELLPDGRSRRLFDAPGQGLRSQDALYARAEENWSARAREHASNGEFLAATSIAE